MKIDKTDRAILHVLQIDGRLSNVNLASKVNLSESACLRRVKLLEDAGVIERYSMIVNQAAVGLPGNVFVEISLAQQQQEELDSFEKRVLEIPEVMECYLMSGDYDYLLRVVVADAADYERIHHQNLTRLPGIAKVRSSFALRTVTKAQELPIKS
ncbi:MAG: Lrp/AsnC family leucine-responsive transcriptional regulator [Gammaproteobacteria bacterium]|jgi:Lrp/AsnC family leucine-responsive transcriptional regulator